MKRGEKPSRETNLYLRDPELRKKLIVVAAATSSAVEGIRVPQNVIAEAPRPGRKPRRTTHRL